MTAEFSRDGITGVILRPDHTSTDHPHGFFLVVQRVEGGLELTKSGVRDRLLPLARLSGSLFLPEEAEGLTAQQWQQMDSGSWRWRLPPFSSNAKSLHSDGPRGKGAQVLRCRIPTKGRSSGFTPLAQGVEATLSCLPILLEDSSRPMVRAYLGAFEKMADDLRSEDPVEVRETLRNLRHKLTLVERYGASDRFLAAVHANIGASPLTVGIEKVWTPGLALACDLDLHCQMKIGEGENDQNAVEVDGLDV